MHESCAASRPAIALPAGVAHPWETFPSLQKKRYGRQLWPVWGAFFLVSFHARAQPKGCHCMARRPPWPGMFTLSECLFFFGIYSVHIGGAGNLWLPNFWRRQRHPSLLWCNRPSGVSSPCPAVPPSVRMPGPCCRARPIHDPSKFSKGRGTRPPRPPARLAAGKTPHQNRPGCGILPMPAHPKARTGSAGRPKRG